MLHNAQKEDIRKRPHVACHPILFPHFSCLDSSLAEREISVTEWTIQTMTVTPLLLSILYPVNSSLGINSMYREKVCRMFGVSVWKKSPQDHTHVWDKGQRYFTAKISHILHKKAHLWQVCKANFSPSTRFSSKNTTCRCETFFLLYVIPWCYAYECWGFK